MPDLWKALGDVYGDADPDGPPTKVEAPAAHRSAPPLDDDLAAALSAALVNAPSAPVTPPAEAATSTPVPPPPPVPAPAPIPAPAPAPASAPFAASEPVVPAEPAAAEKVASWLVEIEQRQTARDKGPDLDAALPAGPTWMRRDDDILPGTKAAKANAKRRRK